MYRFTRPIVGEDNVVNIVGGRHPLQELMVATFVENDAHLAGGGDSDQAKPSDVPSIMLLTGANYSGKSVYLKQVTGAIDDLIAGCIDSLSGPCWKVLLSRSISLQFCPSRICSHRSHG